MGCERKQLGASGASGKINMTIFGQVTFMGQFFAADYSAKMGRMTQAHIA